MGGGEPAPRQSWPDTAPSLVPMVPSLAFDEPLIPDYSGACVSNLVPALLAHREVGDGWINEDVLAAGRVVMLVIDGLGHDQLAARAALTPRLHAMCGGRIDTVAPSTTSSALTSITTGLSPGEHGIVGYKMWAAGEVVNMLRWTSMAGDVSERLDPIDVQPVEPFLGLGPPVVSSRDFARSSFTRAHLRGSEYRGFALPSSIPVEVRAALDGGARFVYAYYDGIDKIAHITGLGAHYDAELAYVDHLVGAVLDALPSGVALVVTADHGQVQVGADVGTIAPEVLALADVVSGEPRFVWLHARGERHDDLLAAACEQHGHEAWVRPVDQVLDERWLGSATAAARARLGDVAIVARGTRALVVDVDSAPRLQSRHGSLTPAEIHVPLRTAVA